MATTTMDDMAEVQRGRTSPLTRAQHILHSHPALSPLIVLLAAVIIFGQLNERFYRPENLSLITQQVSVVGALALGQTLIVLTAGIDLSVGAVMILAQMFAAKMATEAGVPAPLALLLGFGLAAGTGLVNGLLVTQVKLPAFIVTLGTLNVFGALSLLYSSGATVPGRLLPPSFKFMARSFALGSLRVTYGVVFMMTLYAIMGFALRSTAWGRHVYAVGDDIDAARLAGIKVKRVLLSVYVTAGVIFGLTLWILIGRVGAASPNAVPEANLDSITAVVIGGTSLFGGRGAVVGSLLGALIVGVFNNGLSLAGVDSLYRTLVTGILIIAAVSVDQWIRKVRK